MPVINRTIDRLVEMESKLNAASTCEEAFPLWMAKQRFLEELHVMELELNRVSKGWAYMPAN
jgi:hypothetical protein